MSLNDCKKSIGWAEKTWNPVTGCSPCSPACLNCWAKRMHERFSDRPFSEIQFHPERLGEPAKRKKPTTIAVALMGDIFHEDVTAEWLLAMANAMIDAPQHRYLLLTKRPQSAILSFLEFITRPDLDVWIGVSAWDAESAARNLGILDERWPGKTFISLEPLLAPAAAGLKDRRVDWVIVGGENGPGARRVAGGAGSEVAFYEIAKYCAKAGIPHFFKGFGLASPFRDLQDLPREVPWIAKK